MVNLRTLEISLINDRDRIKWRVNLVKGNLIFGWIKPVSS
jgi:hypothetical protein